MKRFEMLAYVALAALVATACGGDDDDGGQPDAGDQPQACEEVGGAACFELPTSVMALEGGGAPNFACDAPTITTSTDVITVNGQAFDFQNAASPIPNPMIAAYDSLDLSGTPVATATGGPDGKFTMMIPAGKAKSRMNFKTTATDWLPTFALNEKLDVTMTTVTMTRRGVSELTANALPAFIGVNRTVGLGVLAGSAVDCDGADVAHVIATVSSTSSASGAAPTFVAGPQVYYFSNGDPNLPVRRSKPENKMTKPDGLFVIIEIPPTAAGKTYFLQTWGFKSQADLDKGMAGLSLLSEIEAPVLGDSVISVSMTPNQGQ